MTRRREYLLDTNIISSKAFGDARSLPSGQHLSCIVYTELMTAADPKEYRAYVETWRRAAANDKLVVPYPDDWLPATRILHLLAQERKKNAGGKSPSRTPAAKQELLADVLIALSAARAGVVVVTDDNDFQAIKRLHKNFTSSAVLSSSNNSKSQPLTIWRLLPSRLCTPSRKAASEKSHFPFESG